jgi:hypothetical protein
MTPAGWGRDGGGRTMSWAQALAVNARTSASAADVRIMVAFGRVSFR